MTDTAELQRLLTWMSPSFPVGAFTYSHGLEWAVETGKIADGDSMTDWISTLLATGSGRSDVVLCSLAHQGKGLAALAELARALCPTEERLLEADMQGQAFIRAVSVGWSHLVPAGGAALPYPIAVGAVAAKAGIDRRAALAGFLHGFAANLVSAGLRLVPLGQSDGVRAMASLECQIDQCATWAVDATESDVWSFVPLSDIASMKHETQYTRLFRS